MHGMVMKYHMSGHEKCFDKNYFYENPRDVFKDDAAYTAVLLDYNCLTNKIFYIIHSQNVFVKTKISIIDKCDKMRKSSTTKTMAHQYMRTWKLYFVFRWCVFTSTIILNVKGPRFGFWCSLSCFLYGLYAKLWNKTQIEKAHWIRDRDMELFGRTI